MEITEKLGTLGKKLAEMQLQLQQERDANYALQVARGQEMEQERRYGRIGSHEEWERNKKKKDKKEKKQKKADHEREEEEMHMRELARLEA